ncbi:MAG TPA: hypothetical protein VGD50_04930, partial [Candidatus Baltobacteraceae bacterium]
MRHGLLVIASVAVFLTCGSLRASGAALPGGFSPENDPAQAQIVSGISAADDPGGCCWMGARATFTAPAAAGADRLFLSVFAPPYAMPEQLGEGVGVVVDDGRLQHVCCVRRGGSRLNVTFERSARPRRIRVTLLFMRTFRPVDVGQGPDTRSLSVLLRGITFEDSRTGEEFDGALVPTGPAAPKAVLLLAIALITLLALVLSLRRPVYGVAALIATTPFALSVPMAGTTLTLPKGVLIAVASAVLFGWARKGSAPRFGPTVGWLFAAQLLFVCSMAASSMHATSLHAALRETLKGAEYAVLLVTVYAAFALDPDEATTVRTFAWTVLAVIALACAAVVIGTSQNLVWSGVLIPRLAGPLEGPNQLAAFLGIALPVLLSALAFGRANRLVWTAAIAGLLATFLTFSRGGIAALAVACVIVAVVAYRPRRTSIVLGACCALWLLAIFVSFGVASGALHASAIFGAADDVRGGLGTRT